MKQLIALSLFLSVSLADSPAKPDAIDSKAPANAKAVVGKEADSQKIAEPPKQSLKAKEQNTPQEAKDIAGKKIIEEGKVAAEKKVAEEAKVAAEKKVIEEAKVAAEKKVGDEAKAAAEKKIADAAKIAAEKKALEEAKIAAEKKIVDEAKIVADKNQIKEDHQAKGDLAVKTPHLPQVVEKTEKEDKCHPCEKHRHKSHHCKTECEKHHHSHDEHHHQNHQSHTQGHKSHHHYEEKVHLKVGSGWEKFLFGPSNSTVKDHFYIHNERPAILKLTDYYCTGDTFAIYDHDKFLGHSTPSHFDNCKTKTYNPDHAFYSDEWSHFEHYLHPGKHLIKIIVLTSPYNEGYGAIRVDPIFNKCCLSINKLTVIDTPMPFSSAEFACRAFGLQLADINIYNFNDATKEVFGCGGAFSSAYIKSYWGNTYQDSCLALYTGNAVPGGAISTPVNCTKPMPVLCQGETHSCLGSFMRA